MLLTLLLKEARLHCHCWVCFIFSPFQTLNWLGNTCPICQKNPRGFKDIFKQFLKQYKNKLTIIKNIIKSDIPFSALFHSQFCILLKITYPSLKIYGSKWNLNTSQPVSLNTSVDSTSSFTIVLLKSCPTYHFVRQLHFCYFNQQLNQDINKNSVLTFCKYQFHYQCSSNYSAHQMLKTSKNITVHETMCLHCRVQVLYNLWWRT